MNDQSPEVKNKALILAELQRYYDVQMAAGDSLDDKIHKIIAAGSLVLALFSTLGMLERGPIWYWTLIIVLAFAYLTTIIRLGLVLLPVEYDFPISADWKNLYTAYVSLEEPALYDQMIHQFITAIDRNDAVIERKAKAVRLGAPALLATLVLLSASRLLLAMSSPTPSS